MPEANITLRHEKEKTTEKKKKKDKKGKSKETIEHGERSGTRSSRARTNVYEDTRTREEIQAEQEEIAKVRLLGKTVDVLADD